MVFSETFLHLIDDTDDPRVEPIAEAILSHTCPRIGFTPPRAQGDLSFHSTADRDFVMFYVATASRCGSAQPASAEPGSGTMKSVPPSSAATGSS